MRYQILLAALCLGILVGVSIFTQPEIRAPTGSASINCYVENELCECSTTECVCGNHTVEADYCNSLNTPSST